MSTAALLWSVLFSSIGLGFFLYGKKQRAPLPLLCGLALMVFPYFVSSSSAIAGIGTVLVCIPGLARR